jgi:signal transduction histidine kinase
MVKDDLLIDVDSIRIAQVLHNIISNAFKFTTSGYIRIRIEELNPGSVTIRISDSGAGIPAEILPTIFDKFVTKSVGDKNIHGTGLGLYISKAIVTAHGGDLTADSNPDGGAVFTITLPIVNCHLQRSTDPDSSGLTRPSPIADAN